VDAEGATCRTKADAPEIDGNLFIDEDFEELRAGNLVTVAVEETGEYDLWGRVV
jgi:ribosomal protein S12 methylthiotransferase